MTADFSDYGTGAALGLGASLLAAIVAFAFSKPFRDGAKNVGKAVFAFVIICLSGATSASTIYAMTNDYPESLRTPLACAFGILGLTAVLIAKNIGSLSWFSVKKYVGLVVIMICVCVSGFTSSNAMLSIWIGAQERHILSEQRENAGLGDLEIATNAVANAAATSSSIEVLSAQVETRTQAYESARNEAEEARAAFNRGDHLAPIAERQQLLDYLQEGPRTIIAEDGEPLADTDYVNAVMAFQRQEGLSPVDGIVGPDTSNKISIAVLRLQGEAATARELAAENLERLDQAVADADRNLLEATAALTNATTAADDAQSTAAIAAENAGSVDASGAVWAAAETMVSHVNWFVGGDDTNEKVTLVGSVVLLFLFLGFSFDLIAYAILPSTADRRVNNDKLLQMKRRLQAMNAQRKQRPVSGARAMAEIKKASEATMRNEVGDDPEQAKKEDPQKSGAVVYSFKTSPVDFRVSADKETPKEADPKPDPQASEAHEIHEPPLQKKEPADLRKQVESRNKAALEARQRLMNSPAIDFQPHPRNPTKRNRVRGR